MSDSETEDFRMKDKYTEMVGKHGVHRTFACTLNNIGVLLFERRKYAAAMGHYQESIQFRTAVRTGTKPTSANCPTENDHPMAPDPSDMPALTRRSEEVWKYYAKLIAQDENMFMDETGSFMSDSDFEDDLSQDSIGSAMSAGRNLLSEMKMDGDGSVVLRCKKDRVAVCAIGMFQRPESSDEGPQGFNTAISIGIEVMGDCAYESAVTLYNMGLVALDRKDPERAEQLFEMALSIAPGRCADVVLPSLNNLGRLYYMDGHVADALDTFEEAVETGRDAVKACPLPKTKKLEQQQSQSSIGSLSTSSITSLDESLPSVCSAEIQQVESGKKRKLDSIQDDESAFNLHRLLVTSMSNVARAQYRQGQYQEALESCESLLSYQRALFHESHFVTHVTSYNIGVLFHMLQQHDDAMCRYQRFYTWARRVLGERHAHVGAVAFNIGVLEFDRRKLALAMLHLLQALSIYESEFGPDYRDNSEILYAIGRLLHDKEEYRDALDIYERALRIQVSTFGSGHASVVKTLCNIGRVCHCMGHLQAALNATERVVSLVKSTSSEAGNEAFLASTLNLAGDIHMEMGNVRSAMDSFEESRAVASRVNLEMVEALAHVSPIHYHWSGQSHAAATA